MATPPNSPLPPEGFARRAHRLVGPVLLILAGILWLLHNTRGLATAVVVGLFLVAWGALGFLVACLPAPGQRHGFFGPLLLMLFGALLLAHADFHSLGPLLARYWPLLLIVWGLGRLLEFYTVGQRRGGLAAGDIFLLLAIILGGLALSHWYRWQASQPWIDQLDVRVGDWFPFLNSYHYNGDASAELQPGDQVVVRSRHGDVALVAANGNAILAQVRDTVRADTEPAAAALYRAGQPRIFREGASWIVEPAGDPADPHLDADLELRLPASVPVTIEATDGDVTASHWLAPLAVTARRGDVVISDLGSDLTLAQTAHGDLSLSRIAGNLVVTGNGDDLTVADIGGSATLRGEFSGDVTLRHIKAALAFHSSRTDLQAASLPGTISFDLDSMTLTGVDALNLETRNKSITASALTGAVRIANQRDELTVTLTQPPAAPINLATTSADLQLDLPAASQFRLEATAERGEISSDFPVQRQQTGATASATAAIGDHPAAAIVLHTTSGNIALRRN